MDKNDPLPGYTGREKLSDRERAAIEWKKYEHAADIWEKVQGCDRRLVESFRFLARVLKREAEEK
jgi:hypothetical protein